MNIHPRAFFLFPTIYILCASHAIRAQDIKITYPTTSIPQSVRNVDSRLLPDPPKPLEKIVAQKPESWSLPDTCAYAIVTQRVGRDGSPESCWFWATNRELLKVMPEGFENRRYRPAQLRSGTLIRASVWYAVIYNPPSAAADAPDATPRLLDVCPVEMTTEEKLALEKARRGGTVWGNAEISNRGKLTGYTLDPEYDYANAVKPAIDAALKEWKFSPARAGGKRVAGKLRLAVRLPVAPTKNFFRLGARGTSADDSDELSFTPAPEKEDIVELPTYTVVGERILPPPESWLYTTIPGFEVLSNASNRQTRNFLLDFLKFQTALRHVWPALVGNNNVRTPTLMIICGQSGSYDSLKLRNSPGNASYSNDGFFVEDEERTAIVIDYNYIDSLPGSLLPANDPYRRLYNQYTRFRLRRSFGKEAPPAWLEAGLARLVETMEFSEKHIKFAKVDELLFPKIDSGHPYAMSGQVGNYGYPNPARPPRPPEQAMGAGSGSQPQLSFYLMPMKEIFAPATPKKSWIWETQSYVFVHMCLYGNRQKYQKGFFQFAMRSLKETVTEEMFMECFGRSYEQMAVEIRSYLGMTAYKYQMYETTRGEKLFSDIEKLAVRDATQAEIGRIKGETLRLGRRPAESRNAFIIPYLRGEREPALLASLGLLESLENRDARAVKFLEAAANANAERPRAYLELAKLRLKKLQSKNGNTIPDRIDEAYAEYIMAPLMIARKQRPPMANVYILIGEMLLRGNIKPNAEQFEIIMEGVRFFPSNDEVVYRAAALHAGFGNPALAAALADHGLRITQSDKNKAKFAELKSRLPAAPDSIAAVPIGGDEAMPQDENE